MGNVVRAESVEMAFGDNEVLSGLDLQLDEAMSLALIGANGCGKTTLMKILAGVLVPQAGQITLLGDVLSKLKRREIARRIAVVPQSSPQVFAFTLLEFVLMGYHARSGLFVPSDKQLDGAHQALQSLALGSLAERPVSQLSGGEMQRALMARAMVASATLWLLDEPTASLDMHHQISLLDQMKRHVDAGGAAVAALHDLALVHRFFDRVAVLHDGQIITHGPPDDVLTASVVSTVYGVQMQRGSVDGKTVWVAKA